MTEDTELSLTQKKMIQQYKEMLKIRRFEEKVSELFSESLIPGFAHLSIAQEAVGVGVCASLRKDHYTSSTHRWHGHCIAKGADLRRMMAELFEKKTGRFVVVYKLWRRCGVGAKFAPIVAEEAMDYLDAPIR
jgi:TPP-dependent pyruvate/acetoin dehydrogenase alpha subunit